MPVAILDKNFLTSGVRLSDNVEDYPEGLIIPIDKPFRWTSADVVRKLKFASCRHFHKKNLKVGHAGTLDPLATGVLLLCLHRATRLAEQLQRHDKEYVAGLSIGATTPSYDLEKEIDALYPHDHVTEELVRGVLPGFVGAQEQIAPLFSAKSVDGVRSYEIARKLYKKGGNLDESAAALLSRQNIVISAVELLDFRTGGGFDVVSGGVVGGVSDGSTASGAVFATAAESTDNEEVKDTQTLRPNPKIHLTDNSSLGLPHIDIRVECSKGTYIRALARDIGEALGSGAHLDSLRRTCSGDFRVENALSVAEAMSLLET